MTLNWREVALLVEKARPGMEGLFVDRIIVPERPRFPGGYVKGEWAIRLTGKRNEGVFIFSVRPRRPYFLFMEGRGPRSAPQATHSAFDLELSKHLKGQRLTRFEALPRERTVVLWFGEELGLAISLFPATPEAVLVRRQGSTESEFRVITRSRAGQPAGAAYVFPDGSKAPENPPVRDHLARELEQSLDIEAFELRLASALREVRSTLKQAEERVRQTGTALREAERDLDWKRFGDLLKASLHDCPKPERGPGGACILRIRDFETGEDALLPSDPKLTPSEQVEKYYQLARRKARRISESKTRLAHLSESATRFRELLDTAPVFPSWLELEKLERGIGAPATPLAAEGRPRKTGAWLGKSFRSRDGLAILVGRSKDENLELTFKHARGNDLWLHVRGRPGAHVLIPLQPGKSAPLETLLDAAALCVYYSGGEKWGKTEVDYAFKKHVRRIKDSTEASYVNNKTLIVEPDPGRLKRLLDSAA